MLLGFVEASSLKRSSEQALLGALGSLPPPLLFPYFSLSLLLANDCQWKNLILFQISASAAVRSVVGTFALLRPHLGLLRGAKAGF